MNLNEIKIIPLLDTLKIEKINDAEYFSKKYNGYISNSRLSLINPDQDGSPEKFFNGFTFSFSTSFQIGSAVHQLILQNDLFELAPDLNKPTAKLGCLADKLYDLGKIDNPSQQDINQAALEIDYYKGNLTENQIQNVYEKCTPYWISRANFEASYNSDKELIYLDKKSSETVSECVKAINSNKIIQELLHPTGLIINPISENEQAILLDIEVHIPNSKPFVLSLKAKLDNYTVDIEANTITVNDVKTISKVVSEMNFNIINYHYNREFAVYSYLLSLCATKFYDLKQPTVKGNYLVVSTIPKYYTKVIPLTYLMFKDGFEEFKYLIRLVAKYYNDGWRFK